MRVFIFSLILGLCFVGCSSRLVISSEPSEARIFARAPGGSDRIELGKTPLEMKTYELQDKIKIPNNSGEYREISIEKEGFSPQKLMLPAARIGSIETKLYAKLEPLPPPQPELAEKMLQHLFNAQQFAQSKSFDRAQAELDEALRLYPKFTRALSMRGTIFYLQQNYTESLKWYEKAIEVDPQYQEAVKMIARLNELLKGGRP